MPRIDRDSEVGRSILIVLTDTASAVA